MTDHQFSGIKSNAPGVAGVARNIPLRISSAGTRVRVGDSLALKVQNETGCDVTSTMTYKTSHKNISVTGAGLIHGIEAGPFSITIDDAAGGFAKFEGECFA
jgi:hypothetical protein